MDPVEILICLATLAAVIIFDLPRLRGRNKSSQTTRERSPPAIEKKITVPQPPIREKQPSAQTGGGKRRKKQEWKTKNNFSHQLLATNIMGHTDKILVGCNDDEKYLVGCAEDEPPPDPGESNSSGSEAGKENSPSESPSGSIPGSPCATRRSTRRRRKPRTREQRQAPSPVPPTPGPLARYDQLKLTEPDLAGLLAYYLLSNEQLTSLGYPVECNSHPCRALIYAVNFSPPPRRFDVNAREFVPGRANAWSREEDSGQGSGSSSPRSPDSDPDSEEERTKLSVERRCARCTRGFFLSVDGEYITTERCRHHWGRLRRVSLPTLPPGTPVWQWACCNGSPKALGCVRAPLHVWSGTCAGLNGPLDGFVRTQPRSPQFPGRQVLALDCEMCYTSAGLQVARLDVVGPDGCSVYSSYVRPDSPIVDYNTRFSGISAKHLQKVTKTLKDVQIELLELIDEETILVGHGLENDLRALRILHGRIVDTAVSFPHERGPPFRRSLKDLAMQHLACSVQESQHCPLEDARASLDLMLWRIQRDFIAYPPSGCNLT